MDSKVVSFSYLFRVFAPITLSLLSGALLLFIDRVFIAHFSIKGLEACATAASVCMFLQAPFMRIASMTNPMVGNLIGENRIKEIGSCVWQLVWFAILSSLLTLPVGWLAVYFVFKNTCVESLAIDYLKIIVPFNCIFPLGIVLSSFFIAVGKRWIVLIMTLVSHAVNLGLNYLLIFGLHNIIPPLGVKGAAIGTTVAQALFCILLFYLFQKERVYHPWNIRVDWKQLIDILKKWGLFGLSKLALMICWLIITRIMLIQGESAILVLSLGGTIFGSMVFLTEGLQHAMLTVVSQLLGAKAWKLVWKAVNSSFLLLACIGGLLAFPCLIFKHTVVDIFVKKAISVQDFSPLMATCVWMWWLFVGQGIVRIYQALIIASGDARFNLMYQVVFECIIVVLPIYFCIHLWKLSPDYLWFIMALTSFLLAVGYYIRAYKEKWA